MKDLITLKKMFSQLNDILDTKQKWRIAIVLFCIVIGSLFELLGVAAMLPFIQALLNPEALMQKEYILFFVDIFHITTNKSVLIVVGVGIILVYIIKNVYLSFVSYLQASFSNSINKELSTLMLKSYMERPYSFFVESGSAEIMRGVSADTAGVYTIIATGFKLISELLAMTFIFTYLLYTDVFLAIGIILVGLLSILIIVLRLKKKIALLSSTTRKTILDRNKWLVESVYGIKDIMVLNRRRYFVNGYDKAYKDYSSANTKYTFFGNLPERVIEALCISGIILSVIVRVALGIDANEFVSELSVFAMGAFRVLPSISRTVGYVNTFVYNRPMVEATYDNIIKARDFLKKTNLKIIEEENEAFVNFENSVILKDISWKYPKSDKMVLDCLSLEIRKGQVVGIIGESGAGKSTLADLLLRLYTPISGEILMDGKNIDTIPDIWSKLVCYIPQTVFLMDDSIRNNIIFGDGDVDEERIWEVLRMSSLDTFVKKLPQGLDTIVGERGVKFSGGQRQRIAIARALYKKPQILILDEATSALDGETEDAVMEAIDSLSGFVTLVIIAHRLTTLKNCNKIFEIENGKALERNKTDVINF